MLHGCMFFCFLHCFKREMAAAQNASKVVPSVCIGYYNSLASTLHAECPYWEERPATPVPSLEETLSSQTKLNTLGLGTTESFRQVTTKGGTTPAVTRGSREATQGRGKVTPKRSAPPPPRGKGRSRFLGGIRKASLMERSSDETEYATPHLYVLQPSAIAQGPHPHDYRHLDQANVQPERQYTHLVRGGSLPPIQICSTTFESS